MIGKVWVWLTTGVDHLGGQRVGVDLLGEYPPRCHGPVMSESYGFISGHDDDGPL